MRRLSESVYGEFYWWGCNPGFITSTDGVMLVDTPQQPIDAMRWRETILDRFGPIRYVVNTEPHWDHVHGNAYFPGAEVIGHEGIAARYLPTLTSRAQFAERMKETDPDSYFLVNHPAYPPNPPTRIFTTNLEIALGQHTIRIFNAPGHTKPQTHVHVVDEGVMFTGDNIFNQCKIWLQECDPWELLATLERMKSDDVLFVPGHGEPCDRAALREQAAIVEAWIDAVRGFIGRGLTEDQAVQEPVPKADPYPLAQRLFEREAYVDEMNVRNLYRRITERERSAV